MGGNNRRNSRQPDYDGDDERMATASVREGMRREQAAWNVEGLVSTFSGQDKTYAVTKWAQDLDDNAEIFQWTPLQTLIVARRSLVGTAALWLRCEKPYKSWEELKAALIKEFSDTIDVKAVHEMMSARRKKNNESCLDYMLTMKELGKRGKMADYVAIKYIIDGIQDYEPNKAVLYGATTYPDFKEKLKIYERICEKTRNAHRVNNDSNRKESKRSPDSVSASAEKHKKCYNCGEVKHIATECPHKDKGLKCFNCNSFGHIASECRVEASRNSAMLDEDKKRKVGHHGQRRSSSNSRSSTKPHRERKRQATYCCECCECELERTPETASNTDSQDGDSGTDKKECLTLTANVNVTEDVNINKRDMFRGKDANGPRNQQVALKKPMKAVNVYNGMKWESVNALIDTGSQVNLMSVEFYNKLGSPACGRTFVTLNGLASRVHSLGLYITNVSVDDKLYKSVSFHIVPSQVMPYAIIMGQQFLQQTVMVMGHGNVCLMPINDEWFRNVTCFVSDLDIIGCEVDRDIQKQVRGMVTSYKPLKTKEAPIQLQIHLRDDTPVALRPRRLALREQQEVDNQIAQWLKDGIIRVSNSEFSSPLVLVRKKDGTLRVCVDYRKVNQKMIKDQYPLPIIADHIDRCQKAKIFSALDLKNGYFHLRVHENSIKYTSFVTMTGQYEFLRAPFGIAICPKVFTRFITCIFQDLIHEGKVIIFIDDLLILAEDEEQAVSRLAQVLKTASEYGLDINWKKSQLMVRRVEYLGHVIEDGTVRPSPGKTEAVMRYPEPRNMKMLHSFIGLCSYFRKFIENFAMIAKPLTDLLKKNEDYQFLDEQQRSFNTLKKALASSPVLKIFNPQLRTELHTDASSAAYGAILLQYQPEDSQLHPIHYMSRRTTEAESKYTSYELEALAIIESVKKFRHYLYGIRFKLVTDCKAFELTLKKRDLAVSTRVARWIILLQDYDFEVEHREGSKMRHVDALSRNPYVAAVFSDLHDNLRHCQQQDEGLRAIMEILKEQPYEDYSINNGLLFKGPDKKLVVPKSMENEILKKIHENGHFAKRKMVELMSKDYYIPQLEKKIENYLLTCVPCLLAKRKEGKQEGYLNCIDKQDIPLHTLHIDHLGPMTETRKQYNYILTVVDAFTKFTWIFPTKSTTSKEMIDKLRLHQQCFGNPIRIISDRGAAFTSKEFEEYVQEEGIQHVKITTGIPRSNGQVERMHRTIISVLTKLCVENPTLWYRHVSRVQRSLNSTYQRSINMSPYELLVGVKMRNKEDLEIYDLLKQENIDNYIEAREDLRVQAKQQILKIQDENLKTYNKKRKESRQYSLGDIVAIRRTQFGVGMKLKPKYLGPYKITKVTGKDRYEMEKLDGTQEGPRRTSSAADFMKPWPADGAEP